MRLNLLFIVAVIYSIIVLYPEYSFSGERYSAKEIQTLIEQQTNTVGQSRILLFDTVYEDRGAQIKREIIKTKNELTVEYKDNVFDCDDMVLLIDAQVTVKIAQTCDNSRGALLLGAAYVECEDEAHAFTLFISNKIVYLYDYQTNTFTQASKYAQDMKFILVLL